MPDTQAPTVPDSSDLAALTPSVAITLLVVVGVSVVLFYIGPILRSRLSKPADPPAAPPSVVVTTGAHALQPQATPALERAADTTQQFIDHLLRQVEVAAAREEALERRIAEKDREIDELEQQITRLNTMLWQQQRGRLG